MRNFRILAALTALTLLLFTSGCSSIRRAQGVERGATLQVDLTKAYAAEPLTWQGMQVEPRAVTDDGVISVHYDPKGNGTFYLYDVNTGDFTEFPRERKENPGYTGQLPDGRYIFLYNDALGRKNASDVYDGIHRSAEIFDKDLHLVDSFALPDEMPIGLLSDYSLQMEQDGSWIFYSSNEVDQFVYNEYDETEGDIETAYYLLNPDFTVGKKLDLGVGFFDGMTLGKSGTVYGYAGDAVNANTKTYRIDSTTMKAEYLESAIPADACYVMTGTGDYELYYCLSDQAVSEYARIDDGIYGMKDDGTSELVVDFRNSDLPDRIWCCYALNDWTFLVGHSDANASDSTLYHLHQRTEEEIAAISLITLAGVNIDRTLVQEVCAYNRSQDQYRIVIKDYGREWAVDTPEARQEITKAAQEWRSAKLDFSPAVEQFKSDLLSGIVPDIICMDDIPYHMLSNKGLLTDLMPLLEADERFDSVLYLPNILNGLKRGEKLERIGFAFTVDTIAAKTEFVGEQQGRSAEEYTEMLQNVPDGMDLFPMTSRDDLTERYLVGSQSAFIDKGSMTCSFDSQAFVQLLQLVDSFPDAGQLPSDEFPSDRAEYYAAMEYGYNYAEDHTLLCPVKMNMPIVYHDTHYSTFRKADMTLVGYPESSGGNGGMYKMDYTISLTSQSDKQAPVMDFILNELGKQRQSKICMESWQHCSLPIMREPLENAILAATRGVHINGNLNEQEMPVLQDYIENVKMYEELDPNVTAIILEEAGKYFSMDCTAESAAKAIQTRVGLYLSEQG